jgi:hypothetical protein
LVNPGYRPEKDQVDREGEEVADRIYNVTQAYVQAVWGVMATTAA